MCDIEKMKFREKKHRIQCETPEEPIYVFIIWKKEKVGVCEKCWTRIAEKDWEIGDDPKPTMEELFSDLTRLGPNPTLTEYKYRGKQITSDGEEEEDLSNGLTLNKR